MQLHAWFGFYIDEKKIVKNFVKDLKKEKETHDYSVKSIHKEKLSIKSWFIHPLWHDHSGWFRAFDSKFRFSSFSKC